MLPIDTTSVLYHSPFPKGVLYWIPLHHPTHPPTIPHIPPPPPTSLHHPTHPPATTPPCRPSPTIPYEWLEYAHLTPALAWKWMELQVLKQGTCNQQILVTRPRASIVELRGTQEKEHTLALQSGSVLQKIAPVPESRYLSWSSIS